MAIFSLNADWGKTGSSNIFQHSKKKMGDTFQIPRIPLPHRRQIGHRARREKNPEILAEKFNQEFERTNFFFFFLKSTTLKNDLRKNSLRDFFSSFINFNFSLFAACVAATLFVLRLSKPKPNNISELSGNEKVFFVRISFVFFPIGKPISQTSNEKRY